MKFKKKYNTSAIRLIKAVTRIIINNLKNPPTVNKLQAEKYNNILEDQTEGQQYNKIWMTRN